MVVTIGTHDGRFHADEALACFLLRQLPEYADALIVRTNDSARLKTCTIVVGTGGKYKPSSLRFDDDFTLTLRTFGGCDHKVKLSSAGLIYGHFGKGVIKKIINGDESDLAIVDQIFDVLYSKLVADVDQAAYDRVVHKQFARMHKGQGQEQFEMTSCLSSRVARLLPNWNSTNVTSMDSLFEKAMEMVGIEFIDQLKYINTVWLPSKVVIDEAFEGRFQVHSSGSILLLKHNHLPWEEILQERDSFTSTVYVVYPDNGSDEWRIECVPEVTDSPRLPKLLPLEWWNVDSETLARISGVPDALFVDTDRLVGGAASLQGVIQMGAKSLEN